MNPLVCLLLFAQTGSVHPSIPLWPAGAPGSETRRGEAETAPHAWSIGNIQNPSLTVYTPAPGTANGTAIVIAPGGGHSELVVGPEGFQPAEYFSKLGITAYVLKYRLAREAGSHLTLDRDTRADAFRAMRMVRAHAAQYGIDPTRIGMIGFSAGGEVLSMAAFGPAPFVTSPDDVDLADGKPSFAIWIYTGPVGIPAEIPANSPPAFLLSANDDGHTSVHMDLAAKYRKANIPMELHILSSGGHGFNMGDRSKLISVRTWTQRLTDWLSDSGYLKPKL